MSNGSFLCDFRISANVHEKGRTVTTEAAKAENRVLGLVVGTLADRFEMTLLGASCQISGVFRKWLLTFTHQHLRTPE